MRKTGGRQDGRDIESIGGRQPIRQTVKRTGQEEKSKADWKAGRYEKEDARKIKYVLKRKPSVSPQFTRERVQGTVLYCTALYRYCTVLYCTVLYSTVIYCTLLYTLLYSTVL